MPLPLQRMHDVLLSRFSYESDLHQAQHSHGLYPVIQTVVELALIETGLYVYMAVWSRSRLHGYASDSGLVSKVHMDKALN